MNKIQLETEQKKFYVAPQMEILEFENRHNILTCSQCNDDNFGAGFNGK